MIEAALAVLLAHCGQPQNNAPRTPEELKELKAPYLTGDGFVRGLNMAQEHEERLYRNTWGIK